MEKINLGIFNGKHEDSECMVIKKQELKNLYKKIRECERMLEHYKKENQYYLGLLAKLPIE